MNIKLLPLFLALFFTPVYSAMAQAYQVKTSQKTVQVKGLKYFEHKVEKGNTLYNLSKAYGVSKADIVQANPILGNTNMRIGQTILIPASAQRQQQYATIYHIVKHGETLYSIARAYQSSVEELKQLNYMSDDALSEGQYIKVYQRSNAEYDELDTDNTVLEEDVSTPQPTYHIVRPKESLYAISKQWGVSVQDIMQANNLKSHHIRAFDTLQIPLQAGTTSAPDLDDQPFIVHHVQKSETLYGIARHYAISVKDIKIYNMLVNNNISQGQQLKIPRKLNKTSHIEHIVSKRKERLKDIAKQYMVPLKKLKALNPQIGRKASRGDRVLIPLPYVESTFEKKNTPKPVETIEEDITPEDEPVIDTECKPLEYQTRSYKIALLLPLELAQLNTRNIYDTAALAQQKNDLPFKFIGFYEGALMAARQLSAQGFDFELQVVDIPKTSTDVASLLRAQDVQNSDLIISLLYTKIFTQAANFAHKYNVPLVNAVSKRRQILYQHPNVYKIQSNEKQLYKTAADFISTQHANDNIIIVRNNMHELSKEYQSLFEQLQSILPQKIEVPNSIIIERGGFFETTTDNLDKPETPETDIYDAARIWQIFKTSHPGFDLARFKTNIDKITPFTNRLHTVVYNPETGLDNILKAINPFTNNIIIGLSNQEVFAIELFTKLNYVNKHLQMQVVGLPHWNQFKHIDLEHTKALDLHVVTSTFINYDNPEVKAFVQNFRTDFNTEPLPNKYAFLGYDIGLYFMTALKNFGVDFDKCLPAVKVPLLERGLKFKTTTLGGKENQYWKVLKQEGYIYKPVY